MNVDENNTIINISVFRAITILSVSVFNIGTYLHWKTIKCLSDDSDTANKSQTIYIYIYVYICYQ